MDALLFGQVRGGSGSRDLPALVDRLGGMPQVSVLCGCVRGLWGGVWG